MSVDENGNGAFDGGDDVLAGEYVLGVLDAATRRNVERRVAAEPDFAARVAHWQEEFSALDAAYGPEPPPSLLFERIERRLFGQERVSAEPESGLWQSLVFWRGLALASLLVVAGLVALTLGGYGLRSDEEGPALVAALEAEGAAMDLVASYDAATGAITITPAALGQPEPRSLELWLIEGDDSAPISLGLIPPTGRGALVVDPELRPRLSEGAVLAISIEPEGGSPTGAPTGPVVAAGATRQP